jgi:putative acyl-CoA dehydrogenase
VALAEEGNARLDHAALELMARARKPVDEAQARWLCERMTLVLQGSLLVRHAPHAVADAFCARHFGEGAGLTYGTLAATMDTAAIIRRQLNF